MVASITWFTTSTLPTNYSLDLLHLYNSFVVLVLQHLTMLLVLDLYVLRLVLARWLGAFSLPLNASLSSLPLVSLLFLEEIVHFGDVFSMT